MLAISFTSCDRTAAPAALAETGAQASPTRNADEAIELYSSLAGKMARMEELLNAIDRFLGDPEFQERLVADGAEFHQLLAESRGLYPRDLGAEDRPLFDRAVDRTLITSGMLNEALQSHDQEAARSALATLDEQRRKAHARFSY